MKVTELPEEILIMIIQYLDTKSIHNLYQSTQHMKNIVSITGVVKKCQMSMNTLATVNSIKTDFFKAIAPHLLELNLCGVPDLRKTYLIPAMKKLKSLQTLDVSFTNLNLIDFLNIYEACPTITSVSINFMMNNSGLSKMSDDSILRCQQIFKNFRHVHFVGSATNLLYSKLPFLLLQEAELESLKYTIAESDRLHTIYVPEQAEKTDMVKFKQFFLCFLDWTTIDAFFGSFFMLPVLSMLDIRTNEAIIIVKQSFKEYCIYTTPIFQYYLQENFNVDGDKVYITDNCKDAIISNAVIMIWNKEAYNFDENFYVKLTKLLKPFFPCDCQQYKDSSVPDRYDWFFLIPEPADRADNDCELPTSPSELKRRRIAPPMNVLNYDELFRKKQRVQLSLIFEGFYKNPISLPSQCDYLQKLTFLSITGAVRVSSDFFNVLFASCVNLVTLNIESPPMSPCTLPISRAICLSPVLKNLRLTDKKIDFQFLFSSLAKCKTLENVYVLELMLDNVDIGNPSIIIDECPNLYNLYIQAPMSESKRIKKSQILHNTKMRQNKHHLNLVLHVKSDVLVDRIFYSYDPFLSVYNLNPIKQILN